MRGKSVNWRRRQPALFLDRDGTLVRDDGYTHRVQELDWLPGAIEAIRHANDNGYFVIVVTNQSGIAREFFTEEEMQAFHDMMNKQLAEHGARIDGFYHCPYHPEGSIPELALDGHPDRKPSPGLIRRAMVEWPIDPVSSIVIGDRMSDLEAGAALGLRGFLVQPGELLEAIKRCVVRTRETPVSQAVADLQVSANRARRWLLERALPYWWEVGYDHSAQAFHEQMTLDGVPVEMPRRIMVQARQAFVYARAGQLGWDGPWQEAVAAGLDVLLDRGLRTDGGTRHLLDNSGRPCDDRRDLYDIAFVLLALGECGAVLKSRADAFGAARRLSEWVEANWRHPAGGYTEGELVPALPRRQNPHMHMLEAFLALYESTGENYYLERSTSIAILFRDRMYQHRYRALPEDYDEQLGLFGGSRCAVVEPGHQFEWSYLLRRYHALGGIDLDVEAESLRATGEIYGVNPTTGIIYEEIFLDGRVKTSTSRLWTHAERMKANIARLEATSDSGAAHAVSQALDQMMDYFQATAPSLWYERKSANGSYLIQNTPASSLYHIVSAMCELIRIAEDA